MMWAITLGQLAVVIGETYENRSQSLPLCWAVSLFCITALLGELVVVRRLMGNASAVFGMKGDGVRHSVQLVVLLVLLADVVAQIVSVGIGATPSRAVRMLRPWLLVFRSQFLRQVCRSLYKKAGMIFKAMALVSLAVCFFGISMFYALRPRRGDPPDEMRGGEYFRDFWTSLFSSFASFFTDNFPEVMFPAYSLHWGYGLAFAVYIIVIVFVLRDLAVAVIFNGLHAAFEDTFRQRDEKEADRMREAFVVITQHALTEPLLAGLNPLAPGGRASYSAADGEKRLSYPQWVSFMRVLKPSYSEHKIQALWLVLLQVDAAGGDGDDGAMSGGEGEVSRAGRGPLASSEGTRGAGSSDASVGGDPLGKTMTVYQFFFLLELLRRLVRPKGEAKPSQHRLVVAANRLVQSRAFQLSTNTLLSLYFVVFVGSLAVFSKPEVQDEAIHLANLIFSPLFLLELLAYLVAEGPTRWAVRSTHLAEFVIVAVPFSVDLILGDDGDKLSYLLLLRIFRLLSLLRLLKGFKRIFNTLFHLIPAIMGTIGLTFISFYAFYIVGYELFAGVIPPVSMRELHPKLAPYFDSGYNMFNFDTPGVGFLTLITVLIESGWSTVANMFVDATRTEWSFLYFVLFYWVTVFLLVHGLAISYFLEAYAFQYNIDYEGEGEEDWFSQRLNTLGYQDTVKRSSIYFLRKVFDSKDDSEPIIDATIRKRLRTGPDT